MDKRTIFILLVFLLLLAACSSSIASQAPNSISTALALENTVTPSSSPSLKATLSTEQAYIATNISKYQIELATQVAALTLTKQYWQELRTPGIHLTWTPRPTRTPGPVKTRTATPIPSATLSPTLTTPTPGPPPISSNDPFGIEMQTKGYAIYNSAAFTHNGYLYSAYIFLSPDPDPPASRETLDKETWILAFYLWDGSENHLLGTTYGKTLNNDSESGTYPYHLQFVDWETPFLGWEFTFMLGPESPDQEIWKLQGFSSDINRNGYPEFAVAGSYGLRSQPYPAFSFYEVNGSSVVDLAAGLPGDILWGPYDKDPSVFVIEKHFITGLHTEILIKYYYRWDGSKFVNVGRGFANQNLPELEEDQSEIEAYFGGPIEAAPFFIGGQYGPIAESVYKILLNYEAIQMPSRGMTFFLEATDPNNWPGSSNENLCYLQYIRAYTQAEYTKEEMFSLPSPSNPQFSLLSFTENLPFMLETVDTETYDLSICEALLETE